MTDCTVSTGGCRDNDPEVVSTTVSLLDINTAFNAGFTAFQRAEEGLQRNALVIARGVAGEERNEDINTALVQSAADSSLASAGASVVRSVDEAVGTLIDEFA